MEQLNGLRARRGNLPGNSGSFLSRDLTTV